MNSSKFTAFGLCVKTELLRTGHNQKWLEEEVRKETGLLLIVLETEPNILTQSMLLINVATLLPSCDQLKVLIADG